MYSLPLLPLLLPLLGLSQEPERLEPSASAEPHKGYAWTSKGGLRYVWSVPKEFDPKRPRNLTAVLHGTGLDYRWGFWNNKPGVFRPNDVVVSVDGTSPGQGETRLFLGEEKDAKAFKAFLEEMRRVFPIDRIFLYGHSQGGFFVVYYAGEFPETVSGVVAHASGAWNWSETASPVKKVAIAFLHGTADPVVPYRQSPGSRDRYAKLGFPLLHLRRLERYNHWPNAVRANEVLSWCDGMTASEPAAALEAVKEILRPKGKDEYQWQTAVGYAGAYDVLRRLTGVGPGPFKTVDPGLAAEGKRLAQRIEEEGGRQVKALKAFVNKKADLKLDGKPWLGHLVSIREDFRGVAPVEEYAKSIDYDAVLDAHAKRAEKILEAWYGQKDPAKIFRTVLAEIASAFLFEGFPPELAEKMEEWRGKAKEVGLGKEDLKNWSRFEDWKKGWDEGLKAYREIWKDWK